MATEAKIPRKGREIIAKRLRGESTQPRRVHWGRDDTSPTDTDSNLLDGAAESKVTGTSSIETTDTENDTYRVVGTLISDSSQTIREVGLFNDADELYIRGKFDGIPLETGDAIQFTIEGRTVEEN